MFKAAKIAAYLKVHSEGYFLGDDSNQWSQSQTGSPKQIAKVKQLSLASQRPQVHPGKAAAT